jgi:Trypsin
MHTLALRRAAVAIALAGSTLLATVRPADALVGGVVAAPADFTFAGRFSLADCGGTLIAPDMVLTSGRCAGRILPGFDYFVRGGQWHGLKTSQSARIVHPLWTGHPSDGHDVGLIQLSWPATGVPTVQVGAPFDAGAHQPGTPATILSRDSAAGPTSRELLRVDTPLRSDAEMAAVYPPEPLDPTWVAPWMIGAGTVGSTSCTGDDGAPLLVQRAGRVVQVGVSSFSEPSPQPCVPGAEHHGDVGAVYRAIRAAGRTSGQLPERRLPGFFARRALRVAHRL